MHLLLSSNATSNCSSLIQCEAFQETVEENMNPRVFCIPVRCGCQAIESKSKHIFEAGILISPNRVIHTVVSGIYEEGIHTKA